MRNDRRERIGNDISEYQKWVDYDMKKYGRISDITKSKIRKAGLSIVKDQYGDYEVIADRPIKEGLNEAKTKEIIVLQGNYGYGWDDLCFYESNQWREAKGDLNDYRENERDALHRLIRRRVPTDGASIKEGCGKLNEKSDYNALRKAKEFIKNATTRAGFYDKIRDILKDAFIEDWDIKQLQRLADAKYAELGGFNESCNRRKVKEACGKKRKIREAIDNYDVNKIAKWIERTVRWLVSEDCGMGTYDLGRGLAICVGWSDGFGEDDNLVIHSTSEPSWAIVAGIKVPSSDDMLTDFDYVNFPYFDNGDVWDSTVSIMPNEDYKYLAGYLLEEYRDIVKYLDEHNCYIEDDGAIVPDEDDDDDWDY